ncbi:MAG: FAD-binding oxidoreductase [Rhodospirillales bacterium]|nr:FAD-binding oxidoreductase [Rhodospirillales bacterium]MBT4626021.1 FAD-binding oxidoreductase [Rhodospirillales bacterium]MBT7778256.1 FAD-binding oxidoreductase [Rhodospirillales bacterium]
MEITHLPHDDRTNGWSAILPPRTPHPSLNTDVSADFVVVGAGYAGLTAARRLAENRPDAKIILVDGGEAGENASGRNSGFGIDLPHNVGGDHDELDDSRRFMDLARMAIDYNEALVRKHNIQCDWARRGKYHTAVTTRGAFELLQPFARELDSLGEPFRWVEGDDLEREIGSPWFTAAVYTPGCVLMNPAALCRGLADTLPDNVTFYENTPVTAVDYAGGITLETPVGSIRAPKMILAVNGLAGQFGFFKNHLLNFTAHASLSRQLTEQERAALGNVDSWGITPANAFVSITMRLTQDHRILIRQNIHYSPLRNCTDADRARIRRDHQRMFLKRFPMLPNVTMEHTWTGYVCLSRNGSPGFGQVAPNAWSAVCQNAVGVTKGTASGLLAADQATNVENPLISHMESLGVADALPPEPFLGLGVRARLLWENWTNRHEH